MDTRYDPHGVERRWQETWEAEGLYKAGAGARPDAATFVICVPPPNVTGELHMGHALNGSMQDCLIRWHRMRGFDTLWQPGYDHAGISTQNVVEKQLIAEGTSRQEIGREAFLERTWQWLETTGRTIMGQFRRLGCSLDYSRERFTMDDGYVEAVMTYFVRLWDAGWIYRANRIVNWCPYHQTAISDLEVEHVEMDDALTYARYPFADGSGSITIATVRPATILADVAVAVSPDDPRYADAIGKEVIVPVVGRRVPVIADARVEPDFGSGALKITPGHDPIDFEIGRDHGLETLTVIGPDGRMTAEGFEGLDPEGGRRARRRVAEGARPAREARELRHSVGTCERCHSRIEPLVSPQWWCRMDELAAPGDRRPRGTPRPLPPREPAPVRDRVARNAPDWCVSRQLWWGHQIPIWTCPDGHRTCAWPPPSACAECGSGDLARETDVLDTWFSSALWPFATLGWPERDPELAPLLPGRRQRHRARDHPPLGEPDDLLGLFLLGEIPFTDVIITSTVMAVDGRRMSKSLGTGIDPLEAVAQFGADATRYGLLKMSSMQDPRFSWGMIEEGAKLANKLWNVARLILQKAEGIEPALRPSTLEEQWIAEPDRGDARRARRAAARVRLRPRRRRALPPDLRRLLRLVRGGDQAAPLRRRCRGAIATALGRARAAARAAPSGAAARDRGDLVAVPRHAPDPRPVAGSVPTATWTPQAAMSRVQNAAAMFRRSGALVALEGDEKRIFDAVVKPDRRGGEANGAVEAENASASREIERGEEDACERALRPERAGGRRRGGAREARSLPQASWSARRLKAPSPGSKLSPWPEEFGLGRMRALLADLGEPQRAFPAIHVVGTNGKTSTTLMTAALLRRRRASGRCVHLAASPRLGRADPGRRRATPTSRQRSPASARTRRAQPSSRC